MPSPGVRGTSQWAGSNVTLQLDVVYDNERYQIYSATLYTSTFRTLVTFVALIAFGSGKLPLCFHYRSLPFSPLVFKMIQKLWTDLNKILRVDRLRARLKTIRYSACRHGNDAVGSNFGPLVLPYYFYLQLQI